MRHLPDRWALPFVYAANKFIFEQDYPVAAEYARRAAAVGKRPHLALLAANLSALADTDDEYLAAVSFLDQTLEQTEEPTLRAEREARRGRVLCFQALSRLEKALAAHRAATGRWPARLAELVPDRLAALPEDPSGGRFEYDPASGAVRKAFGKAPVITREGGSIPVIASFDRILKVPAVMMGIGLHDDNLHAPNEKIDLEQFHKGNLAAAFLFEELGADGAMGSGKTRKSS